MMTSSELYFKARAKKEPKAFSKRIKMITSLELYFKAHAYDLEPKAFSKRITMMTSSELYVEGPRIRT